MSGKIRITATVRPGRPGVSSRICASFVGTAPDLGQVYGAMLATIRADVARIAAGYRERGDPVGAAAFLSAVVLNGRRMPDESGGREVVTDVPSPAEGRRDA